MLETGVRYELAIRSAVHAVYRRIVRPSSDGQGMVEYALILAFIAILVIVALKFLQPAIATTLNRVSNSL